jgi:hypothetical protein
MRSLFSRVQYANGNDAELASLPANCPIIYVANHVTLADNLIALQHTTKYCGRNFVLIAAKETLRYYPNLQSIGALPVSLDAFENFDTFKIIKSIAEQNIAVWYFPQGKLVPQDNLCTSKFMDGIVAFINQFRSCAVVPVGFYYYSFRKPQHAVSVYYSQPHVFSRGVDATTANDLFDAVLFCVNQARDAALSSANSHTAYPWQVVAQPHKEDNKFAEDSSK